MRRTPRAFTLVELLVVIAIIGILAGILLPALGAARRRSMVTVGLANLKSGTQVLAAWSNDHKATFLYPWGLNPCSTDPCATCNSRGGPPENDHWNIAVQPVSGGYVGYDFSAPDDRNNTEFFAVYWNHYLGTYTGLSQSNDALVSPADAELVGLLRGRSVGPGTLAPSSFLYSPTFWSNPARLAFNNGAPVPPMCADSMRVNGFESVAYPSQKVMLWERCDFMQTKYVRVNGASSDEVGAPPPWGNMRSKISAATADGSVHQVDMSELIARASGSLAADQAFVPRGELKEIPLGFKGAARGFSNLSTLTTPAFFWWTRDGIQGRDIAQ
jgi:prepilin-type N-terminal cleavage/methylation domain-containing protein